MAAPSLPAVLRQSNLRPSPDLISGQISGATISSANSSRILFDTDEHRQQHLDLYPWSPECNKHLQQVAGLFRHDHSRVLDGKAGGGHHHRLRGVSVPIGGKKMVVGGTMHLKEFGFTEGVVCGECYPLTLWHEIYWHAVVDPIDMNSPL